MLEFGAGAGLPALSSALGGASKVVITDYPDQSLVDNMVWNADVNLPEEVRGRVDVEGYVWGNKVDTLLQHSEGEGYDLLILSDLVFNHSQVCPHPVSPTQSVRLCAYVRTRLPSQCALEQSRADADEITAPSPCLICQLPLVKIPRLLYPSIHYPPSTQIRKGRYGLFQSLDRITGWMEV